ncbi:MAG: hypothetical protein RQ839_08145 [Thermoproteus sp.]|jgi:hypothetical protein|nr:hypothetical protein [Thermoproteus sp.]MDT7881795.1 hypothetical protein [Thermoproteus sp.]
MPVARARPQATYWDALRDKVRNAGERVVAASPVFDPKFVIETARARDRGVNVVIITTSGNPILRWMKAALVLFTGVALFGVLVISIILFTRGTWYVPMWVGWLVGLVPLALGIGFLTYFARSIALASEALNSLNPTRVSNDLLYDENGEIGVFIIDNEAYKVNRVWITGVGATSILIYNFTPIGISDAIDMLRNLGVEVSP